jgi:hypothetical protein
MSAIAFRPALVRRITQDEWAAALQPGTPSLPWVGPRRQQIHGFVLLPIPECISRATILFLDADGTAVDVCHDGPMYRTAEALKPKLGEVVLLPGQPS